LEGITLEEAQKALVELLGAPAPSSRDPREVYLFAVLKHYQDHYAEPKGYKQMAAIRRASALVDAAFLSFLGSPRVSDLTRLNQRRVWAHMASESGLSAKSIMTYMISVRAAVHYAALPQLVTIADEPVEVQLLDAPVPIFCNQEEIAEHIGGDVSKPREYIPTYPELGRWMDAIEDEDDFRFVMIMLNTCARNEAIFDLDISKQANHEFGTLDLNPVGRRQTKKRRPIIRMTTNLQAWFQHWGDDKPIRQYQDTVEKRLNIMGKRGEETDKSGNVTWTPLNMPEMTCYTLRHFMATNMRRASFPVSKEQRSKWLGHSVNEGSKTTDWYEKFDPDYLEQPMRATEEIIAKLQKHTKRKLFAPKTKAAGKVRVIDGGKL
jgi:integrase